MLFPEQRWPPHVTLKLNAEPSLCMEEGLVIVKYKGRELFVEQHQELSVHNLLLWIILRSERPIPVFTLESFHPPPPYWHLLWYLLISFLPFLCSPKYTVGQPLSQTQSPTTSSLLLLAPSFLEHFCSGAIKKETRWWAKDEINMKEVDCFYWESLSCLWESKLKQNWTQGYI